MAVPKRRHSKSRVRKRRATWKISAPNHVECPQCHKAKLPHHLCPNCGYYKAREVVSMDE
ncbi:MAG: 50S ribosomal protein L32 [Desulfitobacterium sp.]|nr:50S ribosomal protein L32 [Desulfitobacterium sp.]